MVASNWTWYDYNIYKQERVTLVKAMYIDNFYSDIADLAGAVVGLNYLPAKFGLEVPDFNLIQPELLPRFRTILQDDKLEIDEKNSGVFRQPTHIIHFEDFKTPLDWCFTVALTETTFNTYRHVSGVENALENPTLDGRNLFEWKEANASIKLEPNQCVFFRPWLYHSFEGGLTQHYILNRSFDDNELQKLTSE